MVIEEYNQSDYDSYNLHCIDLNSGIIKSRTFDDNEYNFFSPSFYNVVSYPVPQNSGEWVCNDSRGSLWKIDKKEISISRIVDFAAETNKYGVNLEHYPLSDPEQVMLLPVSYNIESNYEHYDLEVDSILIWNLASGEFSRQNVLEGNVFSGDQFRAVSDSMAFVYRNNSIDLINYHNNRVLMNIPHQDEEISKLCYIDDKITMITEKKGDTDDSLTVYVLNLHANKPDNTYKIPYYSRNHEATPGGLMYTYGDDIFTHSTEKIKTQKLNISSDIYIEDNSLSLSDNGYLLFKEDALIDLKTLKEIPSTQYIINPALLKGSNAGSIIYIYSNPYEKRPYYQIRIVDIHNTDSIIWESDKVSFKGFDAPYNRIKVSRSGNHVVLYLNSNQWDKHNKILLFDADTRKIIKVITGEYKEVTISSCGNYVITIDEEGLLQKETSSRIYDIRNGNEISSIPYRIDDFISEDSLLSGTMNGVELLKVQQNKITNKEQFYARQWIRAVHYLESENLIIGGSDQGSVFIWNLNTKSPQKQIQCGSSEILSLQVSNAHLYVLMKDASVKVFDTKNWEELAALKFTINDDDSFNCSWLTPEGYFRVAKQNLMNFHFVKATNAYPLSSYELFLNRPDIILKRLGYADENLINAYHTAYRKRLAYFNLSPDSKFENFELPVIRIHEKSTLSSFGENGEITITLSASDTIRLLKELFITVNGVPVHGRRGLKIPNNHTYTGDIKIALSPGENRIRVTAINDVGVESLPESIDITSDSKRSGITYFIGIGVSEYLADDFNLAFASKDIRDLADYFNVHFENLVIDTLINEAVTKEAIVKLKEKLLKTSLEDRVIFSLSGHGLLDENFDFYFATHDIDFNNPSERGVSYDELEWLLDSIPARKKLFMMDACHSGEVDKDELMARNVKKKDGIKSGVKEYTYRVGSLDYDRFEGVGLQNSFELMQELFTNLNRGSGAVVISAAAGDSYAMESDEWKNGVFTYSVLKGIRTMEADVNDDGEITVSELRDYVSESVQELTNGLQKPTMRQENVEFDFRVW